MSIASTTTGHLHDGVPADTAAPPRRDGAPSAFAQTLRRLERDMWQGAAAGPAQRVHISHPPAPRRGSTPVAPSLVRTTRSSPAIQASLGTTAPQPGTGDRAHTQLGTMAADGPKRTSNRQFQPTGNDAPPVTLARQFPAMSAAAFRDSRPAADLQWAHVAARRARISLSDIAAPAASVPPCRLSVLTGEAGVSVAIRAAGIDDATLAQRTLAELRRLGLPDARLFINGRLFIATNPLPGETHGD
ncbi:hypothetical protein U0E23_19020 [Burkholderia stagnalis]|uniref:hypothetical protein n=1 Tax=Burkholderia stagnalis TaxID=1503054 RepID=UPI002AB51F40|nr:hypothetical protein [Burkholderia stagnalis]MDY7804538.1 hypothetical protein [Burkholderia stagnalis]